MSSATSSGSSRCPSSSTTGRSDVAPTAAFFLVAKFLPALFAPALTARLDQVALRRILPAIYVLEALVFAVLALIAGGDLLSSRSCWCSGSSTGRSRSPARGLTRGAVAARAAARAAC